MSLLDVMEQAANWADLREIDYAMYRDHDEWVMQLKFSDAKGPYSAYYTLPESNGGRMERQLAEMCAYARRNRMKKRIYSRAA